MKESIVYKDIVSGLFALFMWLLKPRLWGIVLQGKEIEKLLNAHVCAWGEELHSAAAHASLSQHPSLTKTWLILDEHNIAWLPASLFRLSFYTFICKEMQLDNAPRLSHIGLDRSFFKSAHV